ncbi:hypothetical protein V8B97DRAFT_2026176 [Scleroderma yunnanense]
MVYQLVVCIPVLAEEELVPSTWDTDTLFPAPPLQHAFIVPVHTSTTPQASSSGGKGSTVNFRGGSKSGEDSKGERYSHILLLSPLSEVELVAKIQKPPGEAGRPGRGRYNIDDKLNWDESELMWFKVNTK